MEELRERLGRKVREEWIAWAKEQPNPKPSWLVPWEDLSEPDKEADRRIGMSLYEEAIKELAYYAKFSTAPLPQPLVDLYLYHFDRNSE